MRLDGSLALQSGQGCGDLAGVFGVAGDDFALK